MKPNQKIAARMLVCLLVGFTFPSFGRVNVVTLPKRDSVQLTIYNSVDLTLVKETRVLTFREGLNRLEFSWANTLIDPTSVEFRALTHADEVEVLDVSFPPRVANTLEWRIQSEHAGEVKVEIRYFTSGISWAADYVVEAEKMEKQMKLSGNVRVNNQSGEDYENAEVRLVVGVIRLVEEIMELARGDEDERLGGTRLLREKDQLGKRAYLYFGKNVESLDSLARDEGGSAGREIVKEGLSEYFLYTVGGRDTVPHGWSKRLPSFTAAGVPLVSYCKYEKEQWGERVMRYYRFRNDEAHKLGKEPLPDGQVKAYRLVTPDGLYSYVGQSTAKYIPIKEEVDLELGPDQEVMVKPVLKDWQKKEIAFDREGNVSGWTVEERWEIELQNSREIEVVVDVRRNFSGDWTLNTGAAHERVDAQKVKFVVAMKPHSQQKLSYTVITRHGSNARR